MSKKPTVPAAEQAVRDAAATLHDAIMTAEQAGYRVTWPDHHRGLPTLAVSETAKVERTRVVPVAENAAAAIEAGTTVSEVRTRVPTGEGVEVVEKTVEVPAQAEK